MQAFGRKQISVPRLGRDLRQVSGFEFQNLGFADPALSGKT